MAENAAPPAAGRYIILMATVVTVVFFTFLLIGIRSCSAPREKEKPAEQVKLSANVVIYSNLDLKDAALVITRLKELKIPYQIKDEGRSIAVARARADEARLGLAEKNLPGGGTVGWEIFDQTKLGATDFDRRIQFIRAISGELSRTINRINAVEDARVQIVIPETQLFEVTKAPVTASVLLKLKPGESLTAKQVNGIVYLVAGSVENLKHENVTIIDVDGNILNGVGNKEVPTVRKETEIAAAPKEEMPAEVVVEKTVEEGKVANEAQAKLELEEALTSKVQSLLNNIFPPNITISRVNLDSLQRRKTTVIILVDKKFKVSSAIKRTTFDAVSAAVGYEKNRGDRIIMKSVTFRAAGMPQVTKKTEAAKPSALITALKSVYRKYGGGRIIFAGIILAVVMLSLLFAVLRSATRSSIPSEQPPAETELERGEKEEEIIPVVEQMKASAVQNPAQVAELIKTWLAEEG